MTDPSNDRDQYTRRPLADSESPRMSAMPESGDDPLGKIGTVLGGRFRIRGHVKGGGFAEVYHGFNINLPNQRVIIKFLRDATLADRFGKEAQLLCRLDHPNICRVIDYFAEEHAIIVPFIDGKDCERIIRGTGPLPPEIFPSVALTITDALAFAHARKIAHRDIKPGNIMIDKHGIPYLIDFGIAKEIDVDSTSTRTGYVALTPQFAAPERQSGDSGYNPFLSDIYEMGVTLCVLATGELPYHNPVYPSLRDWDRPFQRTLSPQLRELLMQAAHPTPTQRIQSAAELASRLRQVDFKGAPEKKSKAPMGIAGAVAVALFAVAIWQFGPWPEGDSTTPISDMAQQKVDPPVTTGTAPIGSEGQQETTTQEPHSNDGSTVKEENVAETAPTVQETQIRLDVVPSSGTIAMIDGVRQSLGTDRSIAAGVHRLRIVNPSFPILERSVRIAGRDTALAYDLAQEFAARDSVDLRIALNPPSSDMTLTLSMNGASRTFTTFPVRDFKRQSGKWAIEVRLSATGQGAGAVQVDSVVTFPYGGGPHIAIRGARGEIDFGGDVWAGKAVVPIQVNWSAPTKR